MRPLLIVVMACFGASDARPPSEVSSSLPLGEMLSPHSSEALSARDRSQIIEVILQAASARLGDACETQNNALLTQGRTVCTHARHCPDLYIHTLRDESEIELRLFFESNLRFDDVVLGFRIIWTQQSEDTTASICYHPRLHPSMVGLSWSLWSDPLFFHRL